MQRIIAPPLPADWKQTPSDQVVWLLPKEGNLYKLNLHSNSTISDGHFSPAQIKEIYQKEGYHGVAFTDHRACVPHPELTDDSFVALTGIEIDFNQFDEQGYTTHIVHINGFARDEQTAFTVPSMPLDYDLINKSVLDLKEKNCIVTVNHPVFSDMDGSDLLKIQNMDGIEVYNSIGTMFNNYSDDTAFYEHFLRDGGKAFPVGGDDCHLRSDDGSPFVEYFQGFTVVKAPQLKYDALIQAMDHGALYASNGPMFHNLWLEGDLLHVQCSPVCGVFVHGKYLFYKAAELEATDCLTDVTIDISGLRACSPYIWVQLRDKNGKKAWATPYWF